MTATFWQSAEIPPAVKMNPKNTGFNLRIQFTLFAVERETPIRLWNKALKGLSDQRLVELWAQHAVHLH